MEEKKEVKKQSKAWRYILRGLTFFVVGGVSFFVAYKFGPNRTRVVSTESDQTTFSKYANKVMKKINTQGETYDISASVENVKIEWESPLGLKTHKVILNGDFDLSLNTLEDFDFSITSHAIYDSLSIDFNLTYLDGEFYFSFDNPFDSSSSTEDGYDYNVKGEEIVKALTTFGIDSYISELFDDADWSQYKSLLSDVSINEIISGENDNVNINISDYTLRLVINSTLLELKSVDLGKLFIEDFEISGYLGVSPETDQITVDLKQFN